MSSRRSRSGAILSGMTLRRKYKSARKRPAATSCRIFSLDSLDFSTLSGTFHASATFVAANGDELVGEFAPGTFSLTPPDANGKVVATFIATLTPVPGASTGRFANVTGGSLVMVATTEPFVLSVNANGYTPSFTYTWEGQGTLEFAKGE